MTPAEIVSKLFLWYIIRWGDICSFSFNSCPLTSCNHALYGPTFCSSSTQSFLIFILVLWCAAYFTAISVFFNRFHFFPLTSTLRYSNGSSGCCTLLKVWESSCHIKFEVWLFCGIPIKKLVTTLCFFSSWAFTLVLMETTYWTPHEFSWNPWNSWWGICLVP